VAHRRRTLTYRGVPFARRDAIVLSCLLALVAIILMIVVLTGRHPKQVRFAEARGVVVSKRLILPSRAIGELTPYIVVETGSGQHVEVRVSWQEFRSVRVGAPVALGRQGTIVSEKH
jgi:hypothetical protein